jgi:hypothetical protein
VCAVAGQPVPPEPQAGRPLLEHVLDFAHRRVAAPGLPVPPVGYLDEEHLSRWNDVADEIHERWANR